MTMNKLIELTLYSVGPVGALVAARRGIQTWIRYESIVSVLVAIVLVVRPFECPCLKSLFDQADQVSVNHLAQTLISSIVSSLFLINSLDEAVYYGHLWSRLFINSLAFIESLISYSHYSNHKGILCFVGSFYLFNLAITIYFLGRIKRPRGSNPFEELANQVAKIESYILLIQGLAIYAQLPLFSLTHNSRNYYSASTSFSRVTGAFILSSGFESFCLKEFIYLRDKRTFMKSRTLASFIHLAFLVSHLANTGFYTGLNIHLTLVVARLATVAYGFIHTPNDPLQQNK